MLDKKGGAVYHMRKVISLIITSIMFLSAVSCGGMYYNDANLKYHQYAEMTPEEIVSELTVEQKAAQMVQPAVYNTDPYAMKDNCYGSVLSTPNGPIESYEWRSLIDDFQKGALMSESGIPMIYGQDDVHGVNYCVNAIYFPHNIGVGAANNEDLAYQEGLITAEEARLCHMIWNFSPVVAQSEDPRWGRTYESYGSDLDLITRISTAYTKGLIDGGLIACAKHYLADGNVVYGTGEQSEVNMLIDRGDAQLSEDEINELLKVYQAQIDAGVQTIMVSHSSLNGLKMHENKEYIMKLKDEMGFKGFIVSDWGSVGNISGDNYEEQVVKSVNAGIDMLMEPDRFDEARQIIVGAVESGKIKEERVNDAVTRIIRVKKDAGVFDDPLFKTVDPLQKGVGSMQYRAVAEKLVEESLVLLKNDNDILPFKEGTKIYITGPAADDRAAQCGGWTLDWNGAQTNEIRGVTTIKETFEKYASSYGVEVITDPLDAAKADVVLLCVGEKAYAEWNGDTEDLELCGKLGLADNRDMIDAVKAMGKPTVTCIVAGRHVILDRSDLDSWDSVVMCYLPGSEGKGISDVLCGYSGFKGKLPSPWYESLDQIGSSDCLFPTGYGLTYADDFVPKDPDNKPEPFTYRFRKYRSGDNVDPAKDGGTDSELMKGTAYTKGEFKDDVYTNSYADLSLNVPSNMVPVGERDQVLAMKNLLSQCTREKDLNRESSKLLDTSFMSTTENIDIKFLNVKKGISGDTDYTAEDYLDDFRIFLDGIADSSGIKQVREDRTRVTLCGEEYVRDVVRAPLFDQYFYFYARKLDDGNILVIEIVGIAGKSPEDYEQMFK